MVKNLKIGKRLGLGFGVILVLLSVVAFTAYMGVGRMHDKAEHMLDQEGAVAEHSGRLRANIVGARRFEKDIFINIGSMDKTDGYFKEWTEEVDAVKKRIESIEKVAKSKEDKELVKRITDNMKAYESSFRKVYGMIAAGQITTTVEANKAVAEAKDEVHAAEKDAKDFATEGWKRMAAAEEEMGVFQKQTITINFAIAAIAIALGIFISILITRSITKPLDEGVGTANRIADGDLTVNIEVNSSDETGQLLLAMKNMVEKLREIVADVKSASDIV
ncbi:MAG: methyl-accepting chemotaxis protein, partial [Nitrospirae bacterium]|nr:methyl-accepting chemotaxis protein [Nitrospirota bacterium]